MDENTLNVSTMEQLKAMAEGEIIELPRFKDDIPFVVKVKRVSLLSLIRKGIVPNTLLSAAEELFYGKKSGRGVDLDQLTNVMYVMAESALVEPSIKDIESVGLELTDEQLVALFNYTQKGLNGIQKFPAESTNNESADDGNAIQSETEQTN